MTVALPILTDLVIDDPIDLELLECEEIIERGLRHFVEVGEALARIKGKTLYQRRYGGFGEYVDKRWPDLKRNYADKVIRASETVLKLGTRVPSLPATETQARPLTTLPADQQIVAWERVLEKADAKQLTITASLVKRTVEELQAEMAARTRPRRTSTARVRAVRAVDPDPEDDEPPIDAYYMVEAWEQLPADERKRIIEHAATGSGSGFNRTNDNVEWALWTWNPVTGCNHGCDYCYARDIANRFYEDLPDGERFTPVFRPSRLHAPRRMKVPAAAATNVGERNVFTGSMTDLFGKWVPQDWIDAVFAEVVRAEDWNFLFLTKFPQRLAEQAWPENAWVGTTVDRQARVATAERAFQGVTAGITWLSVEPMLERLTFTSLEMFDWVVIGGASESSQTDAFQPPAEWVEHLVRQARAAGCQIYFKTNLGYRPREYPQGVTR